MFRNYLDQHKVVIVCSARSGTTKALGTTNLLLQAASEALRASRAAKNGTNGIEPPSGEVTPNGSGIFSPNGNMSPRPRSKSSPRSDTAFGTLAMSSAPPEKPSFNATVDILRTEHLAAARSSVSDPDILKELKEEIERDIDSLRSFLFATQVRYEILQIGDVL